MEQHRGECQCVECVRLRPELDLSVVSIYFCAHSPHATAPHPTPPNLSCSWLMVHCHCCTLCHCVSCSMCDVTLTHMCAIGAIRQRDQYLIPSRKPKPGAPRIRAPNCLWAQVCRLQELGRAVGRGPTPLTHLFLAETLLVLPASAADSASSAASALAAAASLSVSSARPLPASK